MEATGQCPASPACGPPSHAALCVSQVLSAMLVAVLLGFPGTFWSEFTGRLCASKASVYQGH